MKPFCVGEQVVVRYGNRGGQEARVVEKQAAEVYKVRFPDGTLLYYSETGLRVAPGAFPTGLAVAPNRDVQFSK